VKTFAAWVFVQVRCERCRETLSCCRDSGCRYESVEDPSSLRPGDHISWHRPYLIWHHAFVMRQDLTAKQVTLHEYTFSDDGPYAEIVEIKLSHDEYIREAVKKF